MKLLNASTLAAAFLLGTLVSCMKKDDMDAASFNGDMVRVSTFSAQVDTTLWTAQEANFHNGDGVLYISGSRPGDSLASRMSILIDGYEGRGTYFIDSNLNAEACKYNGINYKAQTGQVSVSQDDSDRLSGNFHMTAVSTYGSILVSDGKFTYYKLR